MPPRVTGPCPHRRVGRRRPPTRFVVVVLFFVFALGVVVDLDLALANTRSSTVYFRKQSNGSIFALDSRDGSELELEGTTTSPRLVGLALDRTAAPRLLWSDARAIKSAAADGADARLEIGLLARVRWTGVNFGARRDELLELRVRGTPCVSIANWSPEAVECLVALPQLPGDDDKDDGGGGGGGVTPDDCSIRTTRGVMHGAVRSFDEMRATGYPSPIVRAIDLALAPVRPHALLVHGPWLYWSNSADGRLYRSHRQTTAIEILQDRAWGVRGLAILEQPVAASPALSPPTLWLFFTLESKGQIRRLQLTQGSLRPAEVALDGLDSPRGLAVSPGNDYLYFTEKTGRIYRLRVDALTPSSMIELHTDATLAVTSPLPPPTTTTTTTTAAPSLLVTVSSLTRLDGIAVDDQYIYWSETNSNVLARAALGSFEREVITGGTPDSVLSWPRALVLRNPTTNAGTTPNSVFFVEYTGRISSAPDHSVLINEVSGSNMRKLDQLIQQQRSRGGTNAAGQHVHFFALE